VNATPTVADVTNVRQKLFDNKVPLGDPNMVHYMVNGDLENGFLQLPAFAQNQGAGPVGVDTQLRGSLGQKYGMEIFANQNVQTHTSGVSADATGAVNNAAGYAARTTTIALDAVTAAGTFKAGDTFVIAGNSQRYAITADATADGGGAVAALSFTPGLAAAVADNAVITIDLSGNAKAQNLAFHENAFALVMAPLPETGNGIGAKIASISDPKTRISIRSRLFYVGDSSTVYVALDILYGMKTLDPNKAVRAMK
jgi:hypothetical protein